VCVQLDRAANLFPRHLCPNPFVLITAQAQEGRGGAGPNAWTRKDLLARSSAQSLFQSAVAPFTLNPEWGQRCLLTEVRDGCALGFTVLDRTGDELGPQDFLGQCFRPLPLPLPLTREDREDRGEPLRMPLLNLAVPLPPSMYKRGLSEGIDLRGHGQLWASAQVLPFAFSQAGTLLKMASRSGIFRPRYVVLCEGELRYFDSPMSLHLSKGSMRCADITVFELGPDPAPAHAD